jgi:GNAT superfamily N-acetyltransferase
MAMKPTPTLGGSGLDKAEIAVRPASQADVPGMFVVRTAVGENHLNAAQLARRGITQASVAQSLRSGCQAWVAENRGQVVGFSIADLDYASIFALFVLPAYQGIGLGSRLLELATQSLWDHGADLIWLATEPRTRAAAFYQRRGWIVTGTEGNGDLRLERQREVAG